MSLRSGRGSDIGDGLLEPGDLRPLERRTVGHKLGTQGLDEPLVGLEGVNSLTQVCRQALGIGGVRVIGPKDRGAAQHRCLRVRSESWEAMYR